MLQNWEKASNRQKSRNFYNQEFEREVWGKLVLAIIKPKVKEIAESSGNEVILI